MSISGLGRRRCVLCTMTRCSLVVQLDKAVHSCSTEAQSATETAQQGGLLPPSRAEGASRWLCPGDSPWHCTPAGAAHTARAEGIVLPRTWAGGCSPASAACRTQLRAQISQGSFIWSYYRGNSSNCVLFSRGLCGWCLAVNSLPFVLHQCT